MNLHTSDGKADWESIRPNQRNYWQKLGAATRGIITPGNILSLLGFIIVTVGVYQVSNFHLLSGVALVAIGRSFDVLDGLVAELSGTKSPLGEIIDSTLDKIAIFIALIAFTIVDILPLAVLGVMFLISAWLSSAAILARHRAVNLHPTLSGKLAGGAVWGSLVFFIILAKEMPGGPLWVKLGAYLLFGLFVFAGCYAALVYSKSALKIKPKVGRAAGQFDNFAVILNPRSTNLKRSLARIKELEKSLPKKIKVIKTKKNSREFAKNLKQYFDKNSGQTLLLIGGGDGTVHAVVNFIMSHDNIRKSAVLVPIWGGNANDFAYMLNGLAFQRKLNTVLNRGQIKEIYPLKINVDTKNKTKVHYAACYVGFGASGFVAQQLKKLPTQNLVKNYPPAVLALQEIWGVTNALKKAPTLTAELNGQKTTIFEEIFTNGSRIAKINRLPLKLGDKAYYHVHQSNKHNLISKPIVRLLTDKNFGSTKVKPTKFKLREAALAQFDGEVKKIPKNANITVGLASESIKVLSIKLKK